jgi:hypothetical protein
MDEFKMGSSYPNHYTLKKIRRQVLEAAEYRCQHKGAKCTIWATETHHIDENKSNHSRENLLAVCKKCHAEIHAGERKPRRPVRFKDLPRELQVRVRTTKDLVVLDRARVKKIMVAQKITITELAIRLGKRKSRPYLNTAINDGLPVTRTQATLIAETLGVKLIDVVTDTCLTLSQQLKRAKKELSILKREEREILRKIQLERRG